MDVPNDIPEDCPVCAAPYESVSRHEGGLMVNMRTNERYRRVCFAPHDAGGTPTVDFYHHTHAQVRDRRHAAESDATARPADSPAE